jgi:spore germination protein YaaH
LTLPTRPVIFSFTFLLHFFKVFFTIFKSKIQTLNKNPFFIGSNFAVKMHKFKNLKKNYLTFLEIAVFLMLIFFMVFNPQKIGTFISSKTGILSPVQEKKSSFEVFGFAPYWTLNKLDNVDFKTLTTLAYFGVPITDEGNLNKEDIGYIKLNSENAKNLFSKAHQNNTKVVLTVTMMEKGVILDFLDNPKAQEKTINETVALVNERGMDGVNIDIEYIGDPGQEKRKQFTAFVEKFSQEMHAKNPDSKVTVSVLASSARFPKLYDIKELSEASDGIFMMAYDFATTSSQNAMPTSPLYGYKEKKYWYDVSTAVDDFLAKMPAEKLILGLPWYGYDYPVKEPGVNAKRDQGYSYWYKSWTTKYKFVWKQASYRPDSFVQTYKNGAENQALQTGWDDFGKVGWKAYKDGDSWRIYFLEDEKSLAIKYDYTKEKKLGGVGIWALGFDSGRTELWSLLADKFGDGQIALAKNNE